MNLSLEGKTAVVCGSTQGIGYATAMEMAEMGARLILIARNEGKLKDVVSKLEQISPMGHTYLVADFSNPARLKEVLLARKADIGQVHVLVNNTGGPPAGKAIDAEEEAFEQAFQMHLLCNHILVRQLVPSMKEAGYGRIVNVISTSVKQPLPNLGVSNTIRGAVANWAKTLSNELGPFGITVNNVLPGATHTSRLTTIAQNKAKQTGGTAEEALAKMAAAVPMMRVGQPEEIAHAICFLASPAAAYINGINLPVDGGRTSSL